MSYTIDEIKDDLLSYDAKQFYMKHIVRSDNWYFENVLRIPENKIITAVDDFKIIVSEAMGISYNSIMMVGSGKTGYSLSPKKCFKKFIVEPTDEKKSDIDIAIISLPIFDKLWRDFRKAYDITNKRYYSYISREIYRGYVSDRNINLIEPCRLFWKDVSIEATKKLKQNMYFKNEYELSLSTEKERKVFEMIKKYKLASSEGVNKIANRMIRFEVLKKILLNTENIDVENLASIEKKCNEQAQKLKR